MRSFLSLSFPDIPSFRPRLKNIGQPSPRQVESWNMPKQKESIETEILACPLCGRPVPSPDLLSDHHLVPRSRGGKETEAICVDCHKQIHAMYGNKRLEEELNSVEALLADPKFAKFAVWIARRPFGSMAKARRARDSRRRGRSG
jgi:hypothetical protein